MFICLYTIESHTVGDIEKLNIQWPLKFFRAGFYGFFFLILWRHNDVIFSKNPISCSMWSCNISNERSQSEKFFDVFIFFQLLSLWRHNDVNVKNEVIMTSQWHHCQEFAIFAKSMCFAFKNPFLWCITRPPIMRFTLLFKYLCHYDVIITS